MSWQGTGARSSACTRCAVSGPRSGESLQFAGLPMAEISKIRKKKKIFGKQYFILEFLRNLFYHLIERKSIEIRKCSRRI